MTTCDRLSVYLLMCIFNLISAQSTSEYKKAWNTETFPNPWKDPKRCSLHIPGFICDPDKMLSKDRVLEIGSYLWKRGRQDSCLCQRCSTGKHGIPIGIALMNDAQVSPDKSINSEYLAKQDEKPHYSPSDSYQTWNEFAESFRKSWGFGSCENDALIVMSTQGGAVALGNYTRKLMEGSELLHFEPHKFMVHPEDRYELIMKIIREIHAHRNPKERPKEHENFTMDLVTNKYPDILESQLEVDKINHIRNTIEPEIHNTSMAQVWGNSDLIAAAEDDNFEAPPEEKIDTSLAFILIISLTVLLVCLIALFLIIWYYRTKTGHIQPSAEYTKPQTEEKLPSDIKTVKYEPCQTEEPGLPV